MFNRMNPRRRNSAAVVALVALPLLAAACGSTSGSGGGANTLPATPSLTVIGTDNKFDAKTYAAKAGEVTFAYYNKGNLSHSLLVKASDGTRIGDRLFIVPGKSAGLAVTLTPGTYEVYCDVPGHKESGMDATLTVS